MWVKFVVSSRPCSKGFSPGSSVFFSSLSQKPTLLNFNSIRSSKSKSHLVNSTEIPTYLFIYLFIYFLFTKASILGYQNENLVIFSFQGIRPETHSEGMFSWFPFFFPIKVRAVYVVVQFILGSIFFFLCFIFISYTNTKNNNAK